MISINRIFIEIRPRRSALRTRSSSAPAEIHEALAQRARDAHQRTPEAVICDEPKAPEFSNAANLVQEVLGLDGASHGINRQDGQLDRSVR